MIVNQCPRPAPDLVRRLGAIVTSTLANALDDVGCPDNVAAHIKPVAPGFKVAGPAVTVKESTDVYGTYSSADFRVDAMIDAAEPGDVIAVDEGGAAISTFGGLASLAAKTKGIAGLVVDGGVRDLDEMIECDFPVFARHMVPTTGRGRLKVEAINVAITIGGVPVAPGDIIIGDSTGLVIVPADKAEAVVTLAESNAAADEACATDIRNGMSLAEAMAKYPRI